MTSNTRSLGNSKNDISRFELPCEVFTTPGIARVTPSVMKKYNQ